MIYPLQPPPSPFPNERMVIRCQIHYHLLIKFYSQIKFGYPPSIATSSANKTVNLTKCVPDIRYMGVVQQVEFYPLLLVKRSPYITFHGIVGRSNSGKCPNPTIKELYRRKQTPKKVFDSSILIFSKS